MSIVRNSLVGPARGESKSRTNLLCHLIVAILAACLYVFAVIQYRKTVLDKSHASATTTALSTLASNSPLQGLSWLNNSVTVHVSDEDTQILNEIHNKATMNIKVLAIPETVYAREETTLLCNYVKTQLLNAQDVVTTKQIEMVIKLIESRAAQGSTTKKEMGVEGSLKNSMVVAVLKEHQGNVHFVMAGISMEPKLGLRLINKRQRNIWNDVVNRMLDARLNQEMASLLK